MYDFYGEELANMADEMSDLQDQLEMLDQHRTALMTQMQALSSEMDMLDPRYSALLLNPQYDFQNKH